MTLALVIIGIVVCILASAYFSGSEMSYSSCNKVRLENEEKNGDKRAGRALKLAENYDDTLSAILVGNNLVNTAASSLTTVMIILLTGSDSLNWLGTLVVTVLVIIIGETIPKMFCKKYPNRLAKAVSGSLNFLRILFFPLNFIVVNLVNLLTKGLKEEKENDEEESVEELQSIIETAEDEGVLDSDRSDLLAAAIDFPDVSAEAVMTARVDVEAIDIDDPVSEILKQIMDSGHTRMPVYQDNIDNVIGTIHLNHLLKACAKNPRRRSIRDLIMPPCYVYRTTKLPVVLESLRAARQHLAIVTDEYSGTLGILSMEDVLEQLVGEIWDETDTVEEEVVTRSDGEMEIDGDMQIDDFIELMELDEAEFDFESATVGGWAIEFIGDFPKEGAAFTYENIHVKVLKMDERRVEKLLVTKEKSEEDAD